MGDRILNDNEPQPSPRERLAAALGLDLSYETIWGHTHTASASTARDLIEALAAEPIDISNDAAIETYLRNLEYQAQSGLTNQKTLVEPIDAPLAELQINPGSGPVEFFVAWEDGSSTTSKSAVDLKAHAVTGYHWLTLSSGGQTSRLRWILTPRACRQPQGDKPLNGINCFLPSLRSERNWGAGDLTDLIEFASKLRNKAQFDFIALNPLHAIYNRAPYNNSPYLPLSIFTRNYLYLDIEKLPEFNHCPQLTKLLAANELHLHLTHLRNAEFVDYEAVARLKRFALLILFRQFLRNGDEELKAYRSARGPWLENYCAYLAIDRYLHKRNPDVWHWGQWPEPLKDPHNPETQRLLEQLSRSVAFHAYVEMRLEQQLAEAHQALKQLGYSIGLYQDLALATDRVGADYWAYQQWFAPRVRVGSPPDDFNENGQDWGFPALHPKRHADSGFEYFIQSIRCAARHAGAIRLDHVMRLARLYWIPDNRRASEGAYVRDCFEALLGILALESSRGDFIVIGEDLGTVPGYFRKALDESGILSYRLILFERHGEAFRPPWEYPKQAIASFTTHDLPTFDGWLRGVDLKARSRVGQLGPSALEQAEADRARAVDQLRQAFSLDANEYNSIEFFKGLCRFLAATPSRLRLVNLEEFTAEQEQQNLPGTTSEAPNWQRRVHLPLEQLFEDESFLNRLEIWSKA